MKEKDLKLQTTAGCIASVILGLTLMASAALAKVAVPTVSGPIPANGPPGTDATFDYPQFASEPTFNLSRLGYAEEEYFFQGTATRYQIAGMQDGVAVSSGHSYKTRLLVRRPTSPTKFNGIVIVEWLNVTAGANLDGNWQLSRDYLTREGYAWVGVSVQRVGVQQAPFGLTAWSPKRYGTLDVTAGGTITDDSLMHDIWSQAGQAVRSTPRLLGPLKPKMVLGVGYSQSARLMVQYYNAVHPLHKVYDGFMLFFGAGGPFRTDLNTKLLRINSETEVFLNLVQRQPDSSNLRSWEIAGSSHTDYWATQFRQQINIRDGLMPAPFKCDRPTTSHVNNKYVINAGYQHLVNWVRTGKPPPKAPLLRTVETANGILISRDRDGLALGGIRMADVEVPTATNTGENQINAACRLRGSHEPFSTEKIAILYPTHADYVRKVREVTLQNVKDGFVLRQDAQEIIRNALDSVIGNSFPRPVP